MADKAKVDSKKKPEDKKDFVEFESIDKIKRKSVRGLLKKRAK
jgi:hypothetical protein